ASLAGQEGLPLHHGRQAKIDLLSAPGRDRFHVPPSAVSAAFPRRGRARRGGLPSVASAAFPPPRPALRTGGFLPGWPDCARCVRAATGRSLSGRDLLRANPTGAEGLPV